MLPVGSLCPRQKNAQSLHPPGCFGTFPNIYFYLAVQKSQKNVTAGLSNTPENNWIDEASIAHER